MRLPNLEQAEIAEAKITLYLLNPSHPTGRTKAAFFMAFGFSASTWEVMRVALLAHAVQHEVKEVTPMSEGIHYVIEGTLACPDGRMPFVCVVWRIDSGTIIPRFITAYPRG